MGVFDRDPRYAARSGWQGQWASSTPGQSPARVVAPRPSVGQQLRQLTATKLEERAPEKFVEVRRITGVPIVHPLTDEQADIVSQREVLSHAYQNGFRLRTVQATGLLCWDLFEGLFLPVGVGEGKTLISLMVAERAYHPRVPGQRKSRKVLLLVPSNVTAQLMGGKRYKGDICWARDRVPLTIPINSLLGTREKRNATIDQDYPGLYVMSFHILSRSRRDILADLQPDTIIVDEAHLLKEIKETVKGRRFMRYIEQAKPRLVSMSGTMTSKGILDYWHLIKPALGDRCPLPLTFNLAEEWARVIDSGAAPSAAETGPLRPLVDWAVQNHAEFSQLPIDGIAQGFTDDVAGFRAAYKARLMTTPGVVWTDNEVGTSLVLCNSPAKVDPQCAEAQELERLILQVTQEWLTPCGDEIEHAIHTYKWLYELSAGFYNELYWEEPDELARKRGLSTSQAEEELAKAALHRVARNNYAKELRGWLAANAVPGLDQPLTCGAYMHRNQSFPDPDVYALWAEMKRLEWEGMPEMQSRPIRIYDYKVRHAVEWAKQHTTKKKGALVWYKHIGIGQWLLEHFVEEFGPDRVLHCPSGPIHNETIIDPDNRDKIVLCSIGSHYQSKNLQHFQENFYVQWPRSAEWAEQSIGRTHRQGQTADELIIYRCDTTHFDEGNFAACLNDAVYIHQTTPTRQRIVYATYDPLPKVFPDEWLREQGYKAERLTPEARALMKERFGDYSR